MLISHSHRFIFLHGQKTAGSAITLSLVRYLDSSDVWLNAPSHGIFVDALRLGILPAPATRPEVLDAFAETCGVPTVDKALASPSKLTQKERRCFARAYHQCQPDPPQGAKVLGGWQHVSCKEAKKFVGANIWNDYLKFSFERNPWDRLVSLYWWRWRKEDQPGVSFPRFIRAVCGGDATELKKCRAVEASNWKIYTIDDVVAVDRVARFEEVSAELQDIFSGLGLSFDGWLPRIKGKSRPVDPDIIKKNHVSYDGKLADLVAERFQREIRLLGYECPLLEG